MEKQFARYKTYKRDMKFLLVASGIWPNYEAHPRAFRKLLSIGAAFGSGFTFYCIASFCIKYSSNIKIFTSCLGLMIGFFTIFIKVCILSMYEKDLESLNEGVSTKFEKNLRISKNRPHLLKHFPMFSRFFYVYSYCVGIGMLLLGIIPLLSVRHNKYIRVYPQLLPFNYESGGLVHWAIYAFELYNGFYLWSVTTGVDSVFGLYALHIVGELKLLSTRFRRLSSSPNYEKDLKACILDHYMLIKSRNKLQKVFGFLTIWLAVTCAIALCGLVFQATQLKASSIARIMYLSCHVFIKLVQAYSYSWYGNIITVESNSCLDSIYESHWPGSGDQRFMKDIFIMLLQKPLVFKAKGFMDIRLDMFLKIVHASVSYFFLLRTLDAKIS